MTDQQDGGSAFPNDGAWANGHPEGGMSLRDWFAGQHRVPEGLSVSYAEALTGRKCPTGTYPEVILDGIRFWMEADAAYRYIFADAMLAARAKGEA
jgi:hypothetical protein